MLENGLKMFLLNMKLVILKIIIGQKTNLLSVLGVFGFMGHNLHCVP